MSQRPEKTGWWFDHLSRDWVKITPEEYAEARAYRDRGFRQTSNKYRSIALFACKPTGDFDWMRELESVECSGGVFAAFRELGKSDEKMRAYREREAKRGKAVRFLKLVRALDDERAEELMLDLLQGKDYLEFSWVREADMWQEIYGQPDPQGAAGRRPEAPMIPIHPIAPWVAWQRDCACAPFRAAAWAWFKGARLEIFQDQYIFTFDR